MSIGNMACFRRGEGVGSAFGKGFFLNALRDGENVVLALSRRAWHRTNVQIKLGKTAKESSESGESDT